MNKSRIEWLNGGYSINPIKGLCPMVCKDLQGKEYCYARKMYKRFGWDKTIRFKRLKMTMPANPSCFFVGSTMELFGPWIEEAWLSEILGIVHYHSEHTFIFLTKCPQNLHKWKFPPNAWVGVTATNQAMNDNAMDYLNFVKATVRFMSYEPLQGEISLGIRERNLLKWVIVGGQTGPIKLPKLEWVEQIFDDCQKYHIPIFLKNNIQSLFPNKTLRQEFPKTDKGGMT